jgi:hypothetical protein
MRSVSDESERAQVTLKLIEVVEIGGAETAMLLWIAKRDRDA